MQHCYTTACGLLYGDKSMHYPEAQDSPFPLASKGVEMRVLIRILDGSNNQIIKIVKS
jgi:hypothetical protein